MSSERLSEKHKNSLLYHLRERRGRKSTNWRQKDVLWWLRGTSLITWKLDSFPERSEQSLGLLWAWESEIEGKHVMQLERAKRKLRMLRYPTKSGKHFPLTHSEGKSLSKYRRYSTIYGLGRDTGCGSYKNNQQVLFQLLRWGTKNQSWSVQPWEV